MNAFSFLFLATNTPWVSALATATAAQFPTTAIRFYDWQTYWRLRPTWDQNTASLHRILKVLPPGYAGHLEFLFRPYLQAEIKQWCRQLQQENSEHPWVIAPYPYLAPWVRQVPSNKLIYYNLDDYVLYQPSRKEKTLSQEAELVDQAALTLCISQFQVEALRRRYPHKSDCIHHFPLGVEDEYINPNPHLSAEPKTVGYIGNLIERVDWELIEKIARACPDITFVFIGGLYEFQEVIAVPNWQSHRAAVLALPNVRHIDRIPQDRVGQYYRSFALNWIPYTVTHPFNQAACPTKIMDGIASGRPILSTDIPECRLYPQWISIFRSPEEAVSKIYGLLSTTNNSIGDRSSVQQLEFARQQTWKMRCRTLIIEFILTQINKS
jgi:teichuronic acid biosynthesis glycosyltransferase TuaH